MSTIGLYFGLSQEAANDLRARLNELFGRLGYATETSANTSRERRKPWSGGLPKGLMALDRGELAVVPVPLDMAKTKSIIDFLRHRADLWESVRTERPDMYDIALAFQVFAEALEEAIRRQENVVKEDTGATPQS